MNPLLSKLQPYPFERLRQLFASVTPNPALRHISLGIGEPKHATPPFIMQALSDALGTGLAGYPATAGEPRCARPAPPGSSAVMASSWTRPPRCCP